MAPPMQSINAAYKILPRIMFGAGSNRFISVDSTKFAATDSTAEPDVTDKRDKLKAECDDGTFEPPKPKSMWYNPECCVEPCPGAAVRTDQLYYRISDKSQIKYNRTWAECPNLRVVRKPICCKENIIWPELRKRSRKERPKTACSNNEEEDKKLLSCGKPCEKIRLPNCRRVRDPPKCVFNFRTSKICKKPCTPYPSFSECCKPKAKPSRPVECTCLIPPMMCEVWASLRKRI